MCSPRLPTLAPMRPDRCRGGGGDPAGRGAVDRDGIPDVHDGIHHDCPHLHARGTISFILTVSELESNPPTHITELPRPRRDDLPCPRIGGLFRQRRTTHTHIHTPRACPTRPGLLHPPSIRTAAAVDPHRRSLRSVSLFTKRPQCRP